MRNFMGKADFVWFVGVVEDREDPVQMGRVRVRCFGWHTEDLDKIKTSDLPWAITVNNIQSASVSGVGESPTGLVEGSWVVGFFMDGERAQEPVVLGSLNGVPVNSPDPTRGFNDPYGVYPKWLRNPDTNLAAREATCQIHPARLLKERNRHNKNDLAEEIRKVPLAIPPKLTTIDPEVEKKEGQGYYRASPWIEIPPANNMISLYPHNHVYETENGLLEEYDDTVAFASGTPDPRIRWHRFHPTGTYEEIIADGTRTIKVVGKDYEMYMNGANIYVEGNLNLTVTGNKRELIKGNYHLQVEGETSFDLQKSWQKKVGNNDETEIGDNRAVNIKNNDYETLVKGNQIVNILTGYKQDSIKGYHKVTVQGDSNYTTYGNFNIFAGQNYKLTNLGAHYVTSKGDMTIESPASVYETYGGNQSTQITGNLDIDAAEIYLN